MYLLLCSPVHGLYLLTVFTNFISFCFFSPLSFQVPLMSCASPWRAGETMNGASPNYWHYYEQNFVLFYALSKFMLLWQGRMFDSRCLQYLCLCDNNSSLKKGIFVNVIFRAVTQVCVCLCVSPCENQIGVFSFI